MKVVLPVLLVALGAGEGWFEETLAIDDAGGRIALVHAADGGTRFELELRDVEQGGAVLARAPLGDAAPEALRFTRAGVLLFDGGSARLIDGTGTVTRRFGPARHLALERRDGRELVGELREREVIIHDLARPQPVARRAIAALRLEPPLTWRRGFTEVAGRRAGRYDAASDRRLPDAEVTIDVITGRTLREAPAGDPVAAATIARERAVRPGATAFVFADGGALRAVTADDRLITLQAPAAQALAQQALGDDLIFSAGDRLYRLTPDATAAIPLVELPPAVAWAAARSRVVVLRPHASFGRGGAVVEVIEALPPSPGAVISPP